MEPVLALLPASAAAWLSWAAAALWEEVVTHPYHVALEVFFVLSLFYFYRMPVHKAGAAALRDRPNAADVKKLIDSFKSAPFAPPADTPAAKAAAEYKAPVVARYAGPYAILQATPADTAVAAHPRRPPTTAESAEIAAAAARDDEDLAAGGGAAAAATTSTLIPATSTPAVRVVNGDTVEGRRMLNASTFDFLCFATHPRVVSVAKDTIVKYGCGSCGPRGFYGSLKPHCELESDLARFTETEAAIIYSFHFATTSTLIPCFCSRGDELLVDERVNLVLHQGAALSRSRVRYFRHNDMAHLEQLMLESRAAQRRSGGPIPRRFVVTEGVFRNSGTICPLPPLVALARKHCFRVFLDDSCGFGVLGATGRGTPEHFGMKASDVDAYIGAMSTALGSVGGFCCGGAMLVDHQRLAATGYVFSAALPPYASAAASEVLRLIDGGRSLLLGANETGAARPAAKAKAAKAKEGKSDGGPVPLKNGDDGLGRVARLQAHARAFRGAFLGGPNDGLGKKAGSKDKSGKEAAAAPAPSSRRAPLPPGVVMLHGVSGFATPAAAKAAGAPTAVADAGTAEVALSVPLVHFAATEPNPSRWPQATRRFIAAAMALRELDGILAFPAIYNHEEREAVRPSLRVTLKSEMSPTEVAGLAAAVGSRLWAAFATSAASQEQ